MRLEPARPPAKSGGWYTLFTGHLLSECVRGGAPLAFGVRREHGRVDDGAVARAHRVE